MSDIDKLGPVLAGRYEIDREIGAGGMATVYLARDVRHQRSVALKVLKAELGAVLGVERFLSEIRVTANLQHPNLLPLFDSGEAAGLLYYVMPYVEGESLRARLEREKQLPIDEALRIATAIAGALSYAHDHGVIHRDLKPENILLQAGQPVIADFGIALAVSNAGGARVTQTGLSLGTPQYMSPEQAAGDRAIDGRSDIYSLAAMTYEMIAGEPPHSGTTAQAIIAKLMTAEPQPLTTLRKSAPLHVEAALARALAKLPADRFSSAQQLADALGNTNYTSATTSVRPAVPVRSNRPVMLASAAALLLGVAAVWGWARLLNAPLPPVLRYEMVFDSAFGGVGTRYGRVALSPDGSLMVFTGGPAGQLVLRRRNELRDTPMPGTEAGISPEFSTDGKQVAFYGGGKLMIAPVDGTVPFAVTDDVNAFLGVAWSEDNSHLYVSVSSGLATVEAKAGGTPRSITSLDGTRNESSHTWPEVLPGNRGLLFVARAPGGPELAWTDGRSGKHTLLGIRGDRPRHLRSGAVTYVLDGQLMVAPFDARAHRVTGAPSVMASGLRHLSGLGSDPGTDLAVSRMGTLVYSTPGATVSRELVWVTRDGVVQPVDPSWRGEFDGPRLSPDGRSIAVAVGNSAVSAVWVRRLDRKESTKLTAPGTVVRYPAWLPDGRNVSFYSDASKKYEIWRMPADGSAQATRMSMPGIETSESLWSPDGRWLVGRTYLISKGSGDIIAYRPGADSVPTRLVATPAREFSPTLSPDGRFMAYASDEGTGRLDIHVVPFPNASSATWTVSTEGGSEPVWSHRGNELFYRDAQRNMVAVEVTTSPGFAVVQSRVLFPVAQFFTDINQAHAQYSVTPDDQRFLMVRNVLGTRLPEKVVVVENWFSELKALGKKP